MALKMIDAPPLNAVALGVVDYIWAVEARGFSVDGNLLLVKATYTDSAFSSVPTRTAFWIYDLTLGTYTVCVNDLIAVDRPLEVTDVVISQSSGQTQLVASYHDTGVSSELDPNKLALIRNSVLRTNLRSFSATRSACLCFRNRRCVSRSRRRNSRPPTPMACADPWPPSAPTAWWTNTKICSSAA